MRTLVFVIVLFAASDLYGQTVLDVLRQPTANADLELLNQANQASQNSANAAAKRASLLQKRADLLRSQVDQLEKELAELRAEHTALKKSVIDCREQFLGIIDLLEKQDFSGIAAPLGKLKVTYTTSLLPKLIEKEPAEKVDAEKSIATPQATNVESKSLSPTETNSGAQKQNSAVSNAASGEQPTPTTGKNSPDE
ncbi:MAG: hypothetical protein SFV81_17495 [Pirellulaceae bacterium]|nr:hypothetical protein [Pirellulaceae bacterium]